ncbi:MAG: hypothetical protein HEP71_09295 [Roseivirga sp.]|nr:hypothetical protein [Roseivirga sp.]
MKKLLILFFCSFLALGALAQEKQESASVNIISKQLDKVNSALSKKLDKINKKLEKRLVKLYPQLKGVNLDSLMDERVYQQDKLAKLKDAQLDIPGDTLNPKIPDVNGLGTEQINSLDLPDSTITAIQKLREELMADMNLTPRGLDLHQEMGETMAKLGKTEELMKSLKTPDFPELPDLKIPALPEVPDVKTLLPKDIQGLEGKLTEYSGLMDQYKSEFDGWEEKLLAKVTNLEEVKLLQEQKERMDAYKPLPEGYREKMEGFQTNDFVKEKLQAKAEEIKKVGGKSLQEKFDKAQSKITEAKKKYGSLNSLDDAPKRKPNPYKGEPFLKRIKLGGNFQVNRQQPTSIDAALQLSYIINQNARVGTGFSYRIATQKRITNLDFDDQVLTTRAFFDYTIFRSLYAEALYESSSLEVIDQNDISQGKQWVQSGMLGLGNRFSIANKIQGTFTTLYNFLHDAKSPYNSPWVVRVGFELK